LKKNAFLFLAYVNDKHTCAAVKFSSRKLTGTKSVKYHTTYNRVFNTPFFLRDTTLFTVYNGGGEEQKCRNGKRETVNL